MDFDGISAVISKIIMINSARLKELRSSPHELTDDEEAEFEDRVRERDWLYKIQHEIEAQESFPNAEFKNNMDSRYGQILENIRKAGEGTSTRREPYKPALRTKDNPARRKAQEVLSPRITEKDKAFLKGCAIKGETW